MSMKGRVARWLGGLLLRETSVSEIRDLGDFRRVSLEGELPGLQPGDKLQVLVGQDEVRTWTPIPAPDGALLLVHLRGGESPGQRWIRSLRVGDKIRAIGPARSLRPPEGPLAIAADETGLAVASAFSARAGVIALETGADSRVEPAIEALGLSQAKIVRRLPGDTHHEALAEVLHAAGSGHSALIAGGDRLVRGVRAALRARGVSKVTLKTYWIEGRAGLD